MLIVVKLQTYPKVVLGHVCWDCKSISRIQLTKYWLVYMVTRNTKSSFFWRRNQCQDARAIANKHSNQINWQFCFSILATLLCSHIGLAFCWSRISLCSIVRNNKTFSDVANILSSINKSTKFCQKQFFKKL